MDVLITEPPRLIKVEEAAKLLNIGRSAVYDLIRSGRLRSVKIGKSRRIPREAVDEVIAALTGGGRWLVAPTARERSTSARTGAGRPPRTC